MILRASIRIAASLGLPLLAALAAPAAAGDPGELARGILRDVGAAPSACSQDARERYPDRELICADYPKKFSFFKMDWETTLSRFDLRTQVSSASPWALREGSYVREYEAGDAKLTVRFHEPTGALVLAFTPPEKEGEEAARVLDEVGTPAASARDRLPMAGFGGVSAPVPIPESRVEPALPERAAGLDLEGKVTLQLLVLRDGSVGEVRVLREVPAGWGFAEAAVEAVGQWRFEPARRADEPVDAWFTVYHEFGAR